MKTIFAPHLIAVALVQLLCATSALVTAAHAEVPPWQVLEFERKSLWGTARARIEFKQKSSAEVAGDWQNPSQEAYLMPSGEQVWELRVFSSVGSNQATLQLLMEPHSAAILQRNRFSVGRKNRRNKFYRYHALGVSRIRQEPLPDEVKLAPQQWSESSLQEVRFPELPEGSVVTTPFALLVLVSTTPLDLVEKSEFFLHTDYNLYRVRMRLGENARLQANYQLHGEGGDSSRHQAEREVETIQLLVEATSLAPDKPDFELLGLTGELSILFDRKAGLPLRVIGTAPHLGTSHIDLIAATLSDHDSAH
jgi:hypothetical protein